MSSGLARPEWRAILEYAIARAERFLRARANRSRRAQKKPSRTAELNFSGASKTTADKIWTQLLTDYNAAQQSFDAASDVLLSHLAQNTLPTSSEFSAEDRARAQLISAQARLCGDWSKN